MKVIRIATGFLAPLLIFIAIAQQTSKPNAGSSDLNGTSWRLATFRGADGATLTPDDKSKYTIEFASDGRLSVRIDCNRGTGAWKSTEPHEIQFSPIALTRARCPAAPLNDRMPKDLGDVRSYVLQDGHLFLSLMANAGTYEFERIR